MIWYQGFGLGVGVAVGNTVALVIRFFVHAFLV